jgi:Zn-dependent peptidase ImmA (M78 family)
MKKPNKIIVLGEDIKIQWVKKPIIDQHGRNLAGYYDHVSRKIVIHLSGNEREDMSTFIHELVHCVMHIVGLSQVTNPDISEIFCESLSRFIEKNFKLK